MKLYFSVWESLSTKKHYINTLRRPEEFVCSVERLDENLDNPDIAVFTNKEDAETFNSKLNGKNYIWEVEI